MRDTTTPQVHQTMLVLLLLQATQRAHHAFDPDQAAGLEGVVLSMLPPALHQCGPRSTVSYIRALVNWFTATFSTTQVISLVSLLIIYSYQSINIQSIPMR
jgi:hypothetical protein